MLAKDLISETIPTVAVDDTVKDVLKKMQVHSLSHLPVVDSKKLIGIISKSDICTNENTELAISTYELNSVFVKSEQIFLDIIAGVSKFNLSLMPVVDSKHLYLGAISTKDLLIFWGKVAGNDEHGGVIVLETNINDYMLTEISQIIESNDAKVLNLYVSLTENPSFVHITIKVNTPYLSPIISAFERYEYSVKYRSGGTDVLDHFYNERLHGLINYLNV